MPALTLWNCLLPSVLTALAIWIDARLIGPYFATSEVLGGFGGQFADVFYSDRKMRFALIRRFVWPLVAGAAVTALDRRGGDGHAAIVGLLTSALLVWPLVFGGLPVGISKRDWHLVALYGSVACGFAAAGWTGSEIVYWASGEIEKVGVYPFLREIVAPVLLVSVFTAVAGSSLRAIREKGQTS